MLNQRILEAIREAAREYVWANHSLPSAGDRMLVENAMLKGALIALTTIDKEIDLATTADKLQALQKASSKTSNSY